MRAQEIFEREGFLLMWSMTQLKIGQVYEYGRDDMVPQGSKLVVVGTVTREEAAAYILRNGMKTKHAHLWTYCYKVVAE
jgi:hypothetical protein